MAFKLANETVTRCPNVALRHFGPFPAKRFLEVIDTMVFFSANLAFQNTTDTDTQGKLVNRSILFVYKLLDNECFLIGENQIRQFTTFGQAKQLFRVYFLSVAV